jgi:hypothetical protein
MIETMGRENARPTVSPHEHTVLLGTRHMVRIVKLLVGNTPREVHEYLHGLEFDQRVELLEALRVHEARLLEKGIPIE